MKWHSRKYKPRKTDSADTEEADTSILEEIDEDLDKHPENDENDPPYLPSIVEEENVAKVIKTRLMDQKDQSGRFPRIPVRLCRKKLNPYI